MGNNGSLKMYINGDFTYGGSGNMTLASNNGANIILSTTPNITVNQSGDLNLGGKIGGAYGLHKWGTGTLESSNATGNSWTGVLTISGGKMLFSGAALANAVVGGTTALGGASNDASNIVLDGGTLAASNGGSTDHLFTLTQNGGSLSADGTAITFANAGSIGYSGSGARALTLTGTGNGTLASQITDNGSDVVSLTKAGTGTWKLSGANTYTGATTINSGGTLQIGAGGTTGSLSTSSAITDNGILAFNRTDTVTEGTTFASTISGSGGLTQAGSGTLVLGNANSYTGPTTLSLGTVIVGNNNAFGTSAITWSGNAALQASTSGITLANNITMLQNGSNGQITGTQNVALNGNLTMSGSNRLTVNTGASLTIGGNVYLSNNAGIAGELQLNSPTLVNNVTINGVIANYNGGAGTSGTLSILTGQATLAGNNTYTGPTVINGAGSGVHITSFGSTGVAGNLGEGTLIQAYGTIWYTGAGETTDKSIDVNATTKSATIDTTGATGGVILTGGVTSSVSGTQSMIFTGNSTGNEESGAITNGSGTLAVTKNGTGTWALSGANTYTGATTIAAGGTLQIGNGGTTGSLSTSSVITDNGTLAFNRTDTVTQGTTFANTIGGTGGVTHAGSGTLVLGGINSYSGVTTVQKGTLAVTKLTAGGSNSSIGASSSAASNLVLGTGGNSATLQYTGGGDSTNRQFTVGTGGATLDASGSGAVNFTNTGNVALTAGSARTVTLAGTNTDANTLAAIIGDDGSNATSVTKADAGTWHLAGASTYSGATTVSGGTLIVDSTGSLQNTTSVSVGSGTLGLTAATQIKTTASISLANGGTFATGGVNQTLGALTLSGNSIIDMGSGSSKLTFDSLGDWTAGSTLSIYNWTRNSDQVLFNTTTGLSDHFASITFYSDAGVTPFTTPTHLYGNELTALTAVPEPSTYIGAVALLGLIGWRERRRISALLQRAGKMA